MDNIFATFPVGRGTLTASWVTEEHRDMFSGPDVMDAAAVLGIPLSTRGIRAHLSTSIAIGEVDKVTYVAFEVERDRFIQEQKNEVEGDRFIQEQKKNKMLGIDYSY